MPQSKGLRSGYALSVFRGSLTAAFPVEITARYRGGGSAGTDVIIGRASGNLIREVGGVPLGASGSPVYVGGRLLGAISGTYPPDNGLISITPIRLMLGLKNEPYLEGCPSPMSAGFASPVVAGVSSARALGQLEQIFGRRVIPSPPAGDALTTAPGLDLAPGSPVGIAMMTGDIRVGYIGTTTLVKGKLVYAFGHPVTFAGPICVPLTRAVIFETARGTAPFKVGDIGATIGTATQDRSAGILGTLGVRPKGMVPISVTVTDADRSQTQALSTQAVNMPDQLPRLVLTTIIEAFTRAMNRVGQGVAEWEWSIRLASGQTLEATGRTANLSDIGFAVGMEVWQPLDQAVTDGNTVLAVRLDATVSRTSH